MIIPGRYEPGEGGDRMHMPVQCSEKQAAHEFHNFRRASPVPKPFNPRAIIQEVIEDKPHPGKNRKGKCLSLSLLTIGRI